MCLSSPHGRCLYKALEMSRMSTVVSHIQAPWRRNRQLRIISPRMLPLAPSPHTDRRSVVCPRDMYSSWPSEARSERVFSWESDRICAMQVRCLFSWGISAMESCSSGRATCVWARCVRICPFEGRFSSWLPDTLIQHLGLPCKSTLHASFAVADRTGAGSTSTAASCSSAPNTPPSLPSCNTGPRASIQPSGSPWPWSYAFC